jgi:hypothetical protein
MASTYSSLKFELIATGEQSGAWGDTTNTNIGTAVEQAIVGMATLEAADFTANVATLTLTNSPAAQDARAFCLNIASGAVSAAGTINVPAIQKPYLVINGSSYTVTVKVSGQTGVAVPSGKRTVVYNNGTDVGAQITWLTALDILGNAAIGGTLNVTGVATLGNGAVLGTPASGTVTNLTGTASININGTVGATTPASGAFTSVTASADSSFTSTGALTISKGTTVQRPTPTSGMLRFNTTSTEFEGYNGTTWASVGGAALSNDTSTATNVYPLFASATTGTASTLFTSNAQYLFKPSTGELSVKAPRASNGIVVNSATISSDYTIATGDNGGSFGPVAVNSGVTVTVSSGSTWTVV